MKSADRQKQVIAEMMERITEFMIAQGRITTFSKLALGVVGFQAGPEDAGLIYEEQKDNLVLWTGMTFEALMAMDVLEQRGLIKYRPTTPISGPRPDLPVTTRTGAHDVPHWLYVSIRLYEHPSAEPLFGPPLVSVEIELN